MMNTLGKMLTGIAMAMTLAATAAQAEWVDYSGDAFQQAQAEGRVQLVDVTATWCPVCRVQKPILDELESEAALDEVIFVSLDYDTHKDFLRSHNVPRQSTILIFDGAAEVDRSIAETDRTRLRDFVMGTVDRIIGGEKSDG
ncbi:thioredoxin 1 [Roseovarius sp. MBR-78]|uniref:thioredoxin family protein n=1 Tax=Roseovarius sp. MBR-78 TaxID=3156460 RepID=UPI003390F020